MSWPRHRQSGPDLTLLGYFHRLAVILLPIRRILPACVVVFFSLTAVSLFYVNAFTEQLILPAIAGVLWSGLLWAFIELFQTLPPEPSPHHRFLWRMRLKIRRGFMVLLAATVLLVTILLIWLSLRLFTV